MILGELLTKLEEIKRLRNNKKYLHGQISRTENRMSLIRDYTKDHTWLAEEMKEHEELLERLNKNLHDARLKLHALVTEVI